MASELTDAHIVAWAIRMHATWIEHSNLTYKQVVDIAYETVRSERLKNLDSRQLKRSTAIAIIDALQEGGPTTIRDTL